MRHKDHSKRQIKGSRSGVRCTLYLATLSATRYTPIIRDHHQQLTARGKLAKVAIVACIRKFLVILNAMICDMRPWQPVPPSPFAAPLISSHK